MADDDKGREGRIDGPVSPDMTREGAGRPVPISDEDRARGVVEQREVGVTDNPGIAREAGAAAATGGGTSAALGRSGSGSTTGVPGGTAGDVPERGFVGGTTGTGVGGTTPEDSPIGESKVSGAGRRDEASRK